MAGLAHYSLKEEEAVFIAINNGKKMTGREWLRGMKGRRTGVCTKAKRILRSLEEPVGVNTDKTLVLFRASYLRGDERVTNKIYTEILRLGWRQTSPGAVCFLEENLSDQELHDMGFWWLIGIHKPIVFKGDQYLLSFGRSDLHRSFNVCHFRPDHKWRSDIGFISEIA